MYILTQPQNPSQQCAVYKLEHSGSRVNERRKLTRRADGNLRFNKHFQKALTEQQWELETFHTD